MEPIQKKAKKSKAVDTCSWTQSMDEVLFEAYLYQQAMGNKNGNCMTSSAMDSILNKLKTHFPDKPISKDKIKDHMKYIKAKFNSSYNLFKNGISGFSWDSSTSTWIAEPEVWDALIEDKPEASEWRNKCIPHYDKLFKLFGKDRADGELVEATEIRAIRATCDHDMMDDMHNLAYTSDVTLEGFDMCDKGSEQFTSNEGPSNLCSNGASSSRTNKRARKMVDDNSVLKEFARSFDRMVDIFDKFTTEMVKQNRNDACENDIWSQLVDIGVERENLPDVYMYLVEHPTALRAFKGIPVHERKPMLPRIIPNYPRNI